MTDLDEALALPGVEAAILANNSNPRSSGDTVSESRCACGGRDSHSSWMPKLDTTKQVWTDAQAVVS